MAALNRHPTDLYCLETYGTDTCGLLYKFVGELKKYCHGLKIGMEKFTFNFHSSYLF